MKKLFNLSVITKLFNRMTDEETLESECEKSFMPGLTQGTIYLKTLDEYIEHLFIYSNTSLILPKFNEESRLTITTLRDFDKSGNDALGNLIELKIRLLKNVLNIFDPSYNYNDVIDSILDGSYAVKLIGGFNKHLTFLLGSETALGDTVFVVNNNARLHVRAIVNRAISDLVTLRNDTNTILDFYYSEEVLNNVPAINQFKRLTLNLLNLISIYVGVYVGSDFFILNKKSKRLTSYFVNNANTSISRRLNTLDHLYNNEGRRTGVSYLPFSVTSLAYTEYMISAFTVLRYYRDTNWGEDLLIGTDLKDLFEVNVSTEE